jgi:DNA-binding NarL/FixJ family response regulator
MLRVLVVDDRVDFRQAFAAVLDAQKDLEVVAQAGSLAEARIMLEGVDLALLDRGLPDGVIDKLAPFERMFALIRGDGGGQRAFY